MLPLVALAFAAVNDTLPVTIRLGDRLVESETQLLSATYAAVLTTAVAAAEAPVTLCSTYLGQRGEPTLAAHLILSPDRPASTVQRRHEAHELPVADDARHLCLFDHLQQLLAELERLGLDATIDVADQAVELLDQ